MACTTDDAHPFGFLKMFKMTAWQPFIEIHKMLNISLNITVRAFKCITNIYESWGREAIDDIHFPLRPFLQGQINILRSNLNKSLNISFRCVRAQISETACTKNLKLGIMNRHVLGMMPIIWDF